LEDPGLDRKII